MKLLLDTSVYLRLLSDEDWAETAHGALREWGPHLFLSAVVRAELTQGARGKEGRELVDSLSAPFESAGRVVIPEYADWVRAATIQSRIWDEHPRLRTKRMLHDALIACAAVRIGALLVTDNERDFAIIDEWIPTRRLTTARLIARK